MEARFLCNHGLMSALLVKWRFSNFNFVMLLEQCTLFSLPSLDRINGEVGEQGAEFVEQHEEDACDGTCDEACDDACDDDLCIIMVSLMGQYEVVYIPPSGASQDCTPCDIPSSNSDPKLIGEASHLIEGFLCNPESECVIIRRKKKTNV